jgi:hypothetical protein
MKRIKLKVHLIGSKPGDVVTVVDSIGDFLIRRGWGTLYLEQEPEIMDKVIEPKRKRK